MPPVVSRTYLLQIAGLERHLPVVSMTHGPTIALFNTLGDIELCEVLARRMATLGTGLCEVIFTPELKSITLAHELSRIMGCRYVVARKSAKPYMTEALQVRAKSFTASEGHYLLIDSTDAAMLKDRHVWIVDDVATTGVTLAALEELVAQAGGEVTEILIALREGQSENIKARYLQELPLF